MLKKFLPTLILAFIATPTVATVNVTIPQQVSSWEIGIEDHHTQPANDDANMGVWAVTGTNGILTETTRHTHSVHMDHDLHGRVDATYAFAGNGRDMQWIWRHGRNNHVDTLVRARGVLLNDMGLQILNNTLFPFGWDTIRTKVENDYDSIDVVFAQKMQLGRKNELRFFTGIRYADIDNATTSKMNAELPAPNLNFDIQDFSILSTPAGLNFQTATVKSHSDYHGIGPRAGADVNIQLNPHFNFFGTIAGSLLVGELDQDRHVHSVICDNGNISVLIRERKLSSNQHVVPELDARLGINYTHQISADAKANLGLGFEISNYFAVVNNSGTSSTDSMSHYNSFAKSGPFVRLAIVLA